jgi:membrane protein
MVEHWQRFKTAFWQSGSLRDQPAWIRWSVPPLRVVYAVVRDWWDGELTLRAMSLVYTTLLSIVPLLAVSFSVLKAFGVHSRFEPMLVQLLEPLGSKGAEIASKILSFVDNMKVGVLGTLGLALLFYTVMALMQKIEASFNYTWHVRASRTFGERFTHYLSAIVVGPVLVFSAVGISATLMKSDWMQTLLSVEPLGTLAAAMAAALPTLLIIAAFTFLYVFIPNTQVQIRSALVGATVAGILWQLAGWAFAELVVSSGQYTAVYSALATPIFFMIWLYLGWLILLIGASVAHYHQNPARLLSRVRHFQLSPGQERELALFLLARLHRAFMEGHPGLAVGSLAERLHLPTDVLEAVLERLKALKMVTRDDKGRWQSGRDWHHVPVADFLKAWDAWPEYWRWPDSEDAAPVLAWDGRFQQALAEAAGTMTIAEMIELSPSPDLGQPTTGERQP